MNITEHFTLEEMISSATAERLGIDNAPDSGALSNLYELCEMLEAVRALCGHNPIQITSGFRSLALNRAIRSKDTSAHIDGRAADFKIPRFGSAKDVAERIILSSLEFDQVIYEGTWIHLAISDEPRRQALIATFHDGVAVYNKWDWVT